MKTFIAFLCLSSIALANTNTVIEPSVNVDKLDRLNADMNQNYKLPIKSDRTKLTGYMIHDPLTKLIRTYSVLHIEF